MTITTKAHSGPNPQSPSIERRRLLTAAASFGVAPWLLSAVARHAQCATPAAAAVTTHPGQVGQRRRLGTLEVFPVGLGCQWNPGPAQGTVADYYGGTMDRQTAVALIRKAVDRGATLIDTGVRREAAPFPMQAIGRSQLSLIIATRVPALRAFRTAIATQRFRAVSSARLVSAIQVVATQWYRPSIWSLLNGAPRTTGNTPFGLSSSPSLD